MKNLSEWFYQEIEYELEQWAQNVEPDDLYSSGSADVRLYIDSEVDDVGVEMKLTVDYTCEWVDESFDHAFGTWVDPCPHWEVRHISVYSLDKIEITDESDNILNDFYDIDVEAIENIGFEI